MSQLRDAGATGVLVQGDVSDATVAESIVKEAAEKLGGCDIFVQSVIPPLEDIYEHTLSTEVPLAKWQLALDTQARAFFVCARTAARYMTRGGRILALTYSPGGRTGGWQPWVGMGSAKAALDSIGRYFAVALGFSPRTSNHVGWTTSSCATPHGTRHTEGSQAGSETRQSRSSSRSIPLSVGNSME